MTENKVSLSLLENKIDESLSSGDIIAAIEYSESAIRIAKNTLGETNEDTIRLTSNVATYYEDCGDFLNAERTFLVLKNIFTNNSMIDTDDCSILFQNFGNFLNNMGRTEEAIIYLDSAININKKNSNSSSSKTASLLHTLGNCYFTIGDYENAENTLLSALSLRKTNSGDIDTDVALIMGSLGNLYEERGESEEDLEKADYYLHKSMEVLFEHNGIENEDALSLCLSIADSYAQSSHAIKTTSESNEYLEIAEDYSYKSESLYEEIETSIKSGNNFFSVESRGIAFRNLAIHHMDSGRIYSAYRSIMKSIALIEKSSNYRQIIFTNNYFANFLQDNGYKQKATKYYSSAFEAMINIFSKSDLLSEEERLEIHNNFAQTSGLIISNLIDEDQLSSSNKYNSQAFIVATEMQNRIFSENIYKSKIKPYKNNTELNRLCTYKESLQSKLSKHESFHETNIETTNTSNKNISETVLNLHKKINDIESTIKSEHPEYYNLTRKEPHSQDYIRNNILKEGETLLVYSSFNKYIALFILRHDLFKAIKIPLSKRKLTSHISKILSSLSSPEISNLKKLNPYNLHYLYKALFKEASSFINENDRVILICDDILNTIPFEIMVQEYDDDFKLKFEQSCENRKTIFSEYKNLPYLSNKYIFSYFPSLYTFVSSRSDSTKQRPNYKKDLVAFGDPIFNDQQLNINVRDISNNKLKAGKTINHLPPLPDTADEIIEIDKILGGKSEIFLRENAQEWIAKKKGTLKNTRYILFSTHGLLSTDFLNDDTTSAQPCLVLSLVGDLRGEDGFLTMGDIMETMELDAEVVVLSACNTVGEKKHALNGEGFSGLTRAFMYAGAKGLIVSHWNVESTSTKELITKTFSYIKLGIPPSEALYKARVYIMGSNFSTSTNTRGFFAIIEEDDNNDSLKDNYTKNELQISRSHPYFWAPFVYVGS
ncbi:MAG: CHAT domain-containing protein [Magnetococcales bacterium]|nr:CHAT domain-containing protein [Magnetococcales bacterium]